MIINDLIDYLEREKKFTEEDINQIEVLPVEELIEKGFLVDKMVFVKQMGDQALFLCDVNHSKFKTGDRVNLSDGGDAYNATIIENRPEEISIKIDRDIHLSNKSLYRITYQQSQLLDPIIKALKSLVPGAPGMFFYKTLNKSVKPKAKLPGGLDDKEILTGIKGLKINLNESQFEAITKCLYKPSLLAIQGPPGTGKTTVMSIVAEIFSQTRQRVASLAPTHQGVNNCLNIIRKQSPRRQVVKIGNLLKSESLNTNIETVEFYKFKSRYRKKKYHNNCIIGMTYYSAILNLGLQTSGFAPNVIIIDEAGQIPLSYGAVSGIFGAGSTIFFGDDAQMPPIFHTRLANHKLSKSIFSHIREMHPQVIHPLDTTYRLNEEICNLVGNLFYATENGGTFLKPSANSKDHRFPLELPSTAPIIIKRVLNQSDSIVWVDNDVKESCTDINKKEAFVIANLVSACIKNGFSTNEIAVVTPFRKQSLAIHDELRKAFPQINKIPMIDTVERIQGASVELVIISYCTNNMAYIDSVKDFIYSPNRLNVTISRAKGKIILFISRQMMLFGVHRTDKQREKFEYINKSTKAIYGLRELYDILKRGDKTSL